MRYTPFSVFSAVRFAGAGGRGIGVAVGVGVSGKVRELRTLSEVEKGP